LTAVNVAIDEYRAALGALSLVSALLDWAGICVVTVAVIWVLPMGWLPAGNRLPDVATVTRIYLRAHLTTDVATEYRTCNGCEVVAAALAELMPDYAAKD